MTAAEAARLLAEPATPVPGAVIPGPWEPVNVADPVAFAMDVEGSIAEELVNLQVPEALARYVQARAEMVRALPLLADLPCQHPWHLLDQEAFAWASASYLQGVAAGAAYEHLRRTVVGSTRSCPQCWGMGRLDEDGKRAGMGTGETCGTCAGAGVVMVGP